MDSIAPKNLIWEECVESAVVLSALIIVFILPHIDLSHPREAGQLMHSS